MAHIVLAWELGGGYGHLTRLHVVASELLDVGHKVSLIARSKQSAEAVFSNLDIPVYQSPFYNKPIPNSLEQTPAYVHVLFNVGYGHQAILNRLVSSWYELLCRLSPDMVIADHAPTALMVSRDMDIPRINYGDGFTCPAPTSPLPVLHHSITTDGAKADEAIVLGLCNQALSDQGLSPMATLGDIYQVDETFLMTFPALDHLGHREQMHYAGIFENHSQGEPVCWPQVDGPKVFAYLKSQSHLDEQLQLLAECRLSVVVYVKDMPVALTNKYGSVEHMQLVSRPVCIGSVLEQADFVLSHGGHQLSAQCVKAGIPQVHLPLNLEQQLLAARCHKTGSSIFGENHELSSLLSTALHGLDEMFDNARRNQPQYSYARHPLQRCLTLIHHWLTVRQPVNAD